MCGRSSAVEHNLAKVGVDGSNPFARSINIICMVPICPGGGMVDTGDLKSPGHCDRAGSSPAPGTTIYGTIAKLVRPQPAKLLFAGSSPAGSSIYKLEFIYLWIIFYSSNCREMSEWSNVPVLKTGEGNTSGGSNPPLPAIHFLIPI